MDFPLHLCLLQCPLWGSDVECPRAGGTAEPGTQHCDRAQTSDLAWSDFPFIFFCYKPAEISFRTGLLLLSCDMPCADQLISACFAFCWVLQPCEGFERINGYKQLRWAVQLKTNCKFKELQPTSLYCNLVVVVPQMLEVQERCVCPCLWQDSGLWQWGDCPLCPGRGQCHAHSTTAEGV